MFTYPPDQESPRLLSIRLLSNVDHKNTTLNRDPMRATTGWGDRDAESYFFSKYKAQDKHTACKSIYSVSAEGWLGEKNMPTKGLLWALGEGQWLRQDWGALLQSTSLHHPYHKCARHLAYILEFTGTSSVIYARVAESSTMMLRNKSTR